MLIAIEDNGPEKLEHAIVRGKDHVFGQYLQSSGEMSTGQLDGTCGKQKELCEEEKYCCLVAWEEQEKQCIPKKEDCTNLEPESSEDKGDSNITGGFRRMGQFLGGKESSIAMRRKQVDLMRCCRYKGIPDRCMDLCKPGAVEWKQNRRRDDTEEELGNTNKAKSCNHSSYKRKMGQCWKKCGKPNAGRGRRWYWNSHYNWGYFSWKVRRIRRWGK